MTVHKVVVAKADALVVAPTMKLRATRLVQRDLNVPPPQMVERTNHAASCFRCVADIRIINNEGRAHVDADRLEPLEASYA